VDQKLVCDGRKKLSEGGELGVWQIEETEDYFQERLELFPSEVRQLSKIKGRLRLEWLASRWLLHRLSGRQLRGACLKDEFGKPYLTGSNFEISISHSREVVAVIAAPYNIGIDIQQEVSKIERIAKKFVRPVEKNSLQSTTKIPHLHIYWGAKEALYKAYGRKQLGFVRHLHVDPFVFDLAIGRTTAAIHKDDFHQYFDLFYENVAGFYLVYVIERERRAQ
ncbi:MAG: 4'-phosphopantetheinyl transferase superfamily protein, partial [Bacteroidota bacterium]